MLEKKTDPGEAKVGIKLMYNVGRQQKRISAWCVEQLGKERQRHKARGLKTRRHTRHKARQGGKTEQMGIIRTVSRAVYNHV